MKKPFILPLIMFIVFLIIDVVLCCVLGNFMAGFEFLYFFAATIFLEIALFGCVIIYLIIKNGEKKDD